MKLFWAAWGGALFLGAASAASIPFITSYYDTYFRGREPFFAAPVAAVSRTLHIRNDGYGKGYFGASRNGGRTHKGVDLILKVGQPVFAAKSGRVLFSGDAKGYGLSVDILHPDGLLTRYAHLSALDVSAGDWVAKERIIGKGGKTGNASNPRMTPHLHFEIRQGETPLNPSANLMEPSLAIR